MVVADRPIYRVIFLVLLAPVGAVVTIGALLLFGVDPHLVFLPGHLLKAGFATLGFHAPNALGVLTTAFVWWAVIVAIGLVWERSRRRRAV